MMEDELIGTIIGGCEIVEEIGRGGMATVYRARQLSMSRDVAVKILPRQFLHEPVSLERFKQEASIVARLEHRAIVPVHDYGEHDGLPYLVMRLMDAGSVDDLLAKGPLTPERTLQILEQIAPALDYAHREGVLHRDLKPSNILLDANGDAYLTDFGIARLLGSPNRSLTTGGVVGTPSYMSPEQAQGHELDGRSDLYALGVVVFEMLTGVRPFEGETPYSVAVKQVTEAPPPASRFNPRLPRAVDAVLFKALAKNRVMRCATAAELTAALRAALQTAAPGVAVLEDLPATEPSLNEALKAGTGRQNLNGLPTEPFQPMPGRTPAPNLRPVPLPPVYSIPAVVVPRRRIGRPARFPSRLAWATTVMVIISLLLALSLGAVYYFTNSNSPASLGSANTYHATAIFKLTATRQAIQGTGTPPAPSPTVPVTNTPRVPRTN